ncbi:hypothetical protein TNCT_319101 [Trichonephila clavata]|uniref:Uncharacterized protein n=1 Tax=Trichonephila clavata TaxID=2740835 RepID=A0A8X6F3B1_TRICU|nr:hypothetical protein TNCT_319101 [Trichonephila clavata]
MDVWGSGLQSHFRKTYFPTVEFKEWIIREEFRSNGDYPEGMWSRDIKTKISFAILMTDISLQKGESSSRY